MAPKFHRRPERNESICPFCYLSVKPRAGESIEEAETRHTCCDGDLFYRSQQQPQRREGTRTDGPQSDFFDLMNL